MGTRFSRLLPTAVAATLVLALPAMAEPTGAASPSVAPARTEETKAETAKPDGALIESAEGLRIDWTRGVIALTGLGFSPDRGTLAQRRAVARQTAVSDGTRRLYEALNQLRVSGNAYVRDLTAIDESLRESVRALVASAAPKTVKPWPDGSVEVTLELPLWGEKSLASLMTRAVDLPLVPVTAPVSGETSALVVDGRGTGSQPALSVTLKDEAGKILYQGPVTYFHDPEALAEVAGSKPLQLKARRAVGVTRSDLTLTVDEAKRFRSVREKQSELPVVVLL